ncbi:MAG: hypothetical protein NC044_02655 [Prevotella sp.]|nr:hypothetical protein [Prevotella sp.]
MMFDATSKPDKKLTAERLYGWHTAIFPNKTSLTVGAYKTEEMTVVSGSFGRERIH